jgi:glycosyltransferase involved in cell wall biosynthesis
MNSSLSYYKKSECFEDGISCILYTLNSISDINDVLKTLEKADYDELIISDGGSIDGTLEIAKRYTDKIINSDAGIINQFKAALIHVKFKYIINLEVDHRYTKNFCQEMKNALLESEFIAGQAKLEMLKVDTYWERGLFVFYKIHHDKSGIKGMIGGPDITYTEYALSLVDNLLEVSGASDTSINELRKQHGHKVGLFDIKAYQYEKLDFSNFLKKYFWYGTGDFYFYNNHKIEWSFNRKLKSIFHVFNRYIIDYPLKAIKMGKVLYVPYFWLSAVVRYAGWTYTIIKGK